MRIGILGGTFNPIHNCHLAVAEETLKKASLDLILFIPSGNPPHKDEKDIIEPKDRHEMVLLATKEDPRFRVLDLEVSRPGKSYSVETIREVKSIYEDKNELFFIVGIDAFLEISTWKDAELLLSLCNFLVISRPGFSFSDINKVPFLKGIIGRREAVTGNIRVSIVPNYSISFVEVSPCLISSTEIRERLRKGRPVTGLLPRSVESYIMEKKLYWR
ncbi:MAG: nicotinate-nucleotide adenylyltransferase [Nitrospirota bacterium]